MSQEVNIIIKLKDLASKAVTLLGDRLKALRDQIGEKLAGPISKVKDVLKTLGSAGAIAIAGLAAGFAAATAAASTLAGAAMSAVEAFRESDAAASRLADSIARLSGSSEAAEANLAKAQEQVKSFADQTIFSVDQINGGLAVYLEQTGQVSASTEDMSTILGLAAKKNIEVADAAEQVAQIRKGEIGALIDHTRLTADQEDALNLTTNATERGRKALEMMKLEYQGYAEAMDPSIIATAHFATAKKDLVKVVGEVIDKSGAIPAVLQPVTDAFNRATKYIKDNKDQMRQLVLRGIDLVLRGVESLIAGFVKVLPILTGAGLIIYSLKGVVTILGLAFKLLGAAIVTGFLVVSSKLIGALDTMLAAIVRMSDAVGIGVPDAMRNASKSVGELDKGMTDLADNAKTVTAEVAGAIADEMSAMRENAEAAALIQDKTLNGVAQVSRVVTEARKNIQAEQAKELAAEKEINDESVKRGKKAEELKKSLGSANLTMGERNKLAMLELATLQERDTLLQAQKQLELDLYRVATTRGLSAKERALQEAQAKKTYQDIADAQRDSLALGRYDLELATTTNEARRAELELAKELLAIDQSITSEEERRQARQLALLNAQVAARDRALEQQKEQNDQLRQLGGQLASISQATEEVNKLGLSFGALSSLVADLRDVQADYNRGIISGAQASQAALSTLAGAAVTFADQMGASAAAQAGILSIFEAAASAASFAVGDIYGGVQHAIASGLYAGVAVTSASSGGGAASSGAGGGAATAGANVQEQREASADLLAEKLGAVIGGGGGGVTIVYDARYSTNLGDDAKRAGELFDIVEQAGRRKGFDLGSTKRRRI